jgi:large subunit ribosomal protein L31
MDAFFAGLSKKPGCIIIPQKGMVSKMKNGIHPVYEDATITCACGEVIHTRSTKKDIRVEICSKCHPFFTGRQKLVDTGGRVDRFNKRFNLGKGK